MLGEGTPTSSAVVSADARIEGGPGAYRLTLSWSSYASGGVRSLEAGTCEELTQALALMVALAVDPETRALQTAPKSESEIAPARPTEPPPEPAGTTASPVAKSPLPGADDGPPPVARLLPAPLRGRLHRVPRLRPLEFLAADLSGDDDADELVVASLASGDAPVVTAYRFTCSPVRSEQ